MSLKHSIFLIALMFCASFTSLSTVAQDGNNPTASTPALVVPDTDVYEPDKPQSKKSAGACCHTRGAPECGGSCDICCEEDANPSCVAGSCDPNNTFACTCQVITSCSCK
jgi:hypothetical protein